MENHSVYIVLYIVLSTQQFIMDIFYIHTHIYFFKIKLHTVYSIPCIDEYGCTLYSMHWWVYMYFIHNLFPYWCLVISNFTVSSSVQWHSCVQLLATPWTAAHQASLSITNSWSPPKPMSSWVRDAIQPSHPLSSTSAPALNLSKHQGLF